MINNQIYNTMKRRFFSAAMVPLILMIGMVQTGCFGSFALTDKLYDWNDTVIENKFGKNILFYVLVILPVYDFAVFIDVFILNLVEFWSGTNPLAMQEGEEEQQYIDFKGETYLMIATKNQFEVKKVKPDGSFEESAFLQFCSEDHSWSYVSGDDYKLITAFKGFDQQNNAKFDVYADQGIQTVQVSQTQMSESI